MPASACPYRLLDERGKEIAWANAFLDAQRIRQLSLRSLRAYAFDLLHFARWWQDPTRPLSEITESILLDYVRHQLDQQPKPAPQTVNHRLTVIRNLYRFHHGCEIPSGQIPHPTHLQGPISAGVWPVSPTCRRGASVEATPPCHRTAVGRRSRHILAQLS
jgi:hypothetical protein